MAAVVVVLAGVRQIAWLLGPVFLALMIVIAVAPVLGWMRRHNWPGWLSTLVLVLLVYAVLLVTVAVIIVSIARLATELPQYADKAQGYVDSATKLLAHYGVGPDQIKSLADKLNWGQLVQFVGALLDGIAGLATSLVFLLALLLFLSVEASGVGARLAAIATDRPHMSGALAGFAHGTRTYLVVTTVFGLIVAVLDTVALWIIGVPLAVTWGLLSFITNYIPNVGFILGLIPPALLGLLTGGWGMAVAVIVVYCLLNVIVQLVIQPRFVGDSVGLSITVTFVALLFWAWLIGGLGAILAIPLTLLAKALLVDVDPGAGWLDAFLRYTPVARRAVDAADARDLDDIREGPDGEQPASATAAQPSCPDEAVCQRRGQRGSCRVSPSGRPSAFLRPPAAQRVGVQRQRRR
jgi:predicted PurR-regulated permease PerM